VRGLKSGENGTQDEKLFKSKQREEFRQELKELLQRIVLRYFYLFVALP
jgi:hypothetical protein